ncbi:MAG: DUF721 domain-containing protein [Alphaproteobacteria bacterium]|nr:DUF721 domain-containing protein [Alphaproteobacteria bacterium]
MNNFNKYRPSRIGFYTQAIVKPVFKARGLMEGKIITHWAQIVGDRFANLALPERITFPKGKKGEGTLYLSVTSSSSLFIHYSQGVILEHVNTFFGYKAISKLQMNHGFTPPMVEPEKTIPPLAQEEKEWLAQQMQGVSDPDLKGYLEKLGEAICRR